MKYLDKADTSISLAEAYKQWKAEFVQEYLPGKSNPYGDDTNWLQVFCKNFLHVVHNIIL